MANGRNKNARVDTGRDAGGFAVLPWSVLDCPAYSKLSHPARTLLVEFARQFVRNNNGRLLASSSYLSKRGWNSPDVITRAKRDLLEAGFIYETVMGHRPNRASWYAVTWRDLDDLKGYDAGAKEGFRRGAYKAPERMKSKPTRDELYARGRDAGKQNAPLIPSDGIERPLIAPAPALARSPPNTSAAAMGG